MSKVYIQKFPTVWSHSGSLAQSGSVSSGSFLTAGYARLVGIIIASGSGKDSASCVTVSQSVDTGSNWDFTTTCALSACSGSGFSIEVLGDAAKVTYYGDTTASTAELRSKWMLRPV